VSLKSQEESMEVKKKSLEKIKDKDKDTTHNNCNRK